VRSLRPVDVFVDMCTQRDYLASDGAQPIGNAEQVRSNLKKLMALARWAKLPILSCVDRRRPQETLGLPSASCVVGTSGQRKLACSLLPSRIHVEGDNCLCVSLNLLNEYQQAVFNKEHRDPFTNPKLDRLLTELPTRRFLVFGVSLETSVRLLTLGLMLRDRPVALIHDACGWWCPEQADMTLRQLAAKGCELVTVRQVIDSVLATDAPARASARARRSVA
jgi:nicotinamidase-related amidase